MAATKKQTETTTEARDEVAAEPTWDEAKLAESVSTNSQKEADAAKEEEILASAAAAAPAIEQAAKEMAKERTARSKKPAKKAAEKKAEPKPEAPSVDLTKLLLDGLKAAGVKAKKVAPPTSSHYYKVEVDGRIVAFVNLRKGGALRVEPKLEGGRTPKGFAPAAKVRQGLGYVATIATEKEIANAVAAIKRAAEEAASVAAAASTGKEG